MKKILTTLLALTLLLCCFVGCNADDSGLETITITNLNSVIKDSDKTIVLTPEDAFDGKTLEVFLYNAKKQKLLDYSVNAQNMVSSINGIENPADYSSCWMLYTDDAENSNEAWGVITYNDKAYSSATLGAHDLIIAKGCVYIWVYTTF